MQKGGSLESLFLRFIPSPFTIFKILTFYKSFQIFIPQRRNVQKSLPCTFLIL